MEFPKFTSMMYKNQLQDYTQKNVKQLIKVFHMPQSSEQGSWLMNPSYECIHNKMDAKDFSLIYKEPMLCKSILYEFAVKKNLDRPIYNTRYAEGPSSVYICLMVLGGKTYKGELAGSKKMAKQVAARAAIESLLETDAGTLSQIITSQHKCQQGIQTQKDIGNLQGQKASIERAVVCFNTEGLVGNCGDGSKRKTATNNWGRNKTRRFDN
ncbi:unnamed protein product [Withania somnifera]